MGISTDPAFKLMMTSQSNIMYLPFERFENEETEACLHLKLAKEIRIIYGICLVKKKRDECVWNPMLG